MDFLRLPMVGGVIDYNRPYVCMTVEEVKKNLDNLDTLLGAKTLKVATNSAEAPSYAILLVSDAVSDGDNNKPSISDFNDTVLNSVIGISWYAAMKLMKEAEAMEPKGRTQKATFLTKFFHIRESGGNPSSPEDTKHNKKTIIGFIHGVHAYMQCHDLVNNIPDLTTSIPERYTWVYTQLQSMPDEKKLPIQQIWTTLFYEYIRKSEDTDYMKHLSEQGLTQFIHMQQPAGSAHIKQLKQPKHTADINDIIHIAVAFPIHDLIHSENRMPK